MDAVLQLSSTVGIESACDVLGVARASFYRQRPLLGPALSVPFSVPVARPIPARALSFAERATVRALLNSERCGVERLITQRDQLLQRYNREPQAIDAITRSYEKMIAMEEKAAREAVAVK